jgi:hypothetical protein
MQFDPSAIHQQRGLYFYFYWSYKIFKLKLTANMTSATWMTEKRITLSVQAVTDTIMMDAASRYFTSTDATRNML